MKKLFSLVAAVLFAGSMMAETLVEYNGTSSLPAGVTISGSTAMKNVKIHTNTDGVDCIQLANGYTTEGLFNGNAIILHHEGGFTAGDTLKIAGFFNNADNTKIAKAEVITVNAELGCTAVWTSSQFINGRLVNDEPVLEAYVLEADMDSIIIGRNGGTGANLRYIAVIRPEAAPAPAEVELLYEFDTNNLPNGDNNSYTGFCDVEIDEITWNINGNAQIHPYRLGGKSITAAERTVYSKTAYPVALDTIVLKLGMNTLNSVDGIKLVYSTNADFSDAQTITAEVPETFPADVKFVAEFPANCYYKFVITCTVSGSSNKYIQFVGVEFWGVPAPAPAVEKPEFDIPAGSYYDPQTIHLSCATPDSVFYYTTDGTEPTRNSNLYYPQYGIYLSESATIKAIAFKNDLSDSSDVVTKDYQIAIAYASLSELVEVTPDNQKVVVTLTNEVIDSLYTNKSSKVKGIYLTVAGRMVEIYTSAAEVPADWEVGGTVSGTIKGEWQDYNGTWEVCPANWDGITYKAALPDGPALTVNMTDSTFSIVLANEEDIFFFSLLTPEAEGGVNIENAQVIMEAQATWVSADFTLEEYVEEGMAYQGSLENFPLSAISESFEPGTYALAAATVAENDPVAHTAALTSKVSYVEFTISDDPTAVENIKAVKATKALMNGKVVIIRNGARYNVAGQIVK